MFRRVVIPFVSAAEHPGHQLQRRFEVVSQRNGSKATAAWKAAFDGGARYLACGEQTSVEQLRVEKSQPVVQRVDLGDDVEQVAIVRAVPTAKELGKKPGCWSQQRDGRQAAPS